MKEIAQIIASSLRGSDLNSILYKLIAPHRYVIARYFYNKDIKVGTLPPNGEFLAWTRDGECHLAEMRGHKIYVNRKEEDLFNNPVVYFYPL